jgi:TRAP-type uncharacterized transport system fused permease subunit
LEVPSVTDRNQPPNATVSLPGAKLEAPRPADPDLRHSGAGVPRGAEAVDSTNLPRETQEYGWGLGPTARLLFWIAVVFSTFQLWTAAYAPLASQITRAVHVGFLLLLLFGLIANRTPEKRGHAIVLWLLGIAGFATGLYHWYFYAEILFRAGDPNSLDIAVGTLAIVLVFVAGRMMMGWALPIICATFLAYGMFGEYLPSPLRHRGYDFEQIIDALFLGTEGIYGTPIYVSSTYIFLFILFGAFLERAGMIGLFNDIALGTVGHTRGGPAKVSVVSSALMGTINGSGVANVVTTGQFTIPLMKRFGFRSAFAGGVEATASMGGQIMPPVMGAVAFIMAETLGVPYIEVVKAAIVPALLYFVTVFWMVHLESGRLGLAGVPKSECPSAIGALRDKWYLILPLAALVWLLFSGYTPLFAGTVGLGLTALIILGLPVALNLGPVAVRAVFWIVLGLLAGLAFNSSVTVAGFQVRGITAIIILVALLVAANVVLRGGRETPGALPGKPRRRRQERAAGRHCLRAGRRYHRRAGADGCRHQLRARHRHHRREFAVPVAAPHDAVLPHPRHGRADHPQLHHHFVDCRGRRSSISACRSSSATCSSSISASWRTSRRRWR